MNFGREETERDLDASPDRKRSARNVLVAVLVFLVIGFIAGVVVMWLLAPLGAAEPEVLEGVTTAVMQDGSAIGFAVQGTDGQAGEPESYWIRGARWRENGLPWQESFPTCVDPGRTGQRLRMGVVEYAATDFAASGRQVVWLECLEG